MTKEERNKDPVIDLRGLPHFRISLCSQHVVETQLRHLITPACGYRGKAEPWELLLVTARTLFSYPEDGTLLLSVWLADMREYVNADDFDTWKSFTDALCDCAYTPMDRDQADYVRALREVAGRVCNAWRQIVDTCKEEPDAGSPGHPDPKSSKHGFLLYKPDGNSDEEEDAKRRASEIVHVHKVLNEKLGCGCSEADVAAVLDDMVLGGRTFVCYEELADAIKTKRQGGAMKEGQLVVRCNLGGRLIPQEDVKRICWSLFTNGVLLLFEQPRTPETRPMVDALAWAWKYCAEHGGIMPLEDFVSTFKGLAYNAWTHAPVMRVKFAMAVEQWRSKRTAVRERLDRSVLRSEAELYYIARDILRVWPESWEPGMVRDKKGDAMGRHIPKRSFPDAFYKEEFGRFLNDRLDGAFGLVQCVPYFTWRLLCGISKVDADSYTVSDIKGLVYRMLWDDSIRGRDKLFGKTRLTMLACFRHFSVLVDTQIESMCADLPTDEEREALRTMQQMLHDIVNAMEEREAWLDETTSDIVQELSKEPLGAPCAAEERPVDKDCFRTPECAEDLPGFGPDTPPQVRFKSWAEYPCGELPPARKRREIMYGVLHAMIAWTSLNAMDFDVPSADRDLSGLFQDFDCSVMGAGGSLDLARHQLLNAHTILNHVMTRHIIACIADDVKMPYHQVRDYLCAVRLRLEWLLDSQEDAGRKGAATAPCTCGHEFETETKGENTTMSSIFGNLFNRNLFGKPETNRFKLDYVGRIAVDTGSGYKVYDTGKKRLINCSSFCTSFGSDMFFVVPTNKPKAGDIILQANGAPRCVIEVTDEGIRVLDYESSRIETIVPERHVLLGNFCLYGKVISLASKLFPGGVRGLLKGDDGEVSLKGVMLLSMFKDGSNPFEGGDGMMQLLLFSKLMRGEGDKSFKSILLLKLMEQKGGDASGMLPLLLADECGGSVKDLLLMQAASGGKGGDITQLLLMQSLMKDGDGSLDFGDLFGDDDEALAEKSGKPAKKK